MPRANSSANDFAQTLFDVSFPTHGLLETSAFNLDAGSSADLELDDLSLDLASLAPLKLERQHGRIYSELA